MAKTVTIGIATREEINARFVRAMTTGKRAAPFIGFADERALWSTLTPLRWDILKEMTGAGPLALREIARRVGRDVRGVHTDVHALLAVGLIERDEAGFRFPYDGAPLNSLRSDTAAGLLVWRLSARRDRGAENQTVAGPTACRQPTCHGIAGDAWRSSVALSARNEAAATGPKQMSAARLSGPNVRYAVGPSRVLGDDACPLRQ